MAKLPDLMEGQLSTPQAPRQLDSYRPNPIGEAVTGLGDKGMDVAQKQLAIINETKAANADADFATKVGDIKGKFTSLTGQAAYDAFPQYQQDIKQAFQESRANLPPAAQAGFDMMAMRSMASHVADGSSYASSQLKAAKIDAGSSLANQNIQALLDPNVAADPSQVKDHLDKAVYGAQMQIDRGQPGFKVDPETGMASFDESTPEGNNLKNNLQQKIDTYVTQGQVNRFDALAKQDVLGAYNTFLKERNNMPRAAQVNLDAAFEPKVFTAHVQNATGTALEHASQQHYSMLIDPQKQVSQKISNAIFTQESGNSFGSQMSSSGAIGGAQVMPATFSEYAKPGENINNPLDNKAVGKRIIDDYTKRYNGDAARVAVAYFSGPGNVAPEGSPTPWIKDKIDTDGKSVSSYVSDVTNRVGGLPQKSYATNPDGGLLTLPDYYASHSQDVYAKGDAYAEKEMPGDLAFKRAVHQSLENYMTAAKQNQAAQYKQDNVTVMRAITGESNNGTPPSTYAELRALPGMEDILDRVAVQDPKFSEGIETQIARVAKRGVVTNSPNGYDTILRTLEPNDNINNPNRIESVDHLDKLLGRTDGTGINIKDYQDAKQAIELDPGLKSTISKHMQDITNANGNIDGNGEQRALSWYNQTMAAWKQNTKLGEKALSPTDFAGSLEDGVGKFAASRIMQIENWADAARSNKAFDYDSIKSGHQYTAPDGTIRTKQ